MANKLMTMTKEQVVAEFSSTCTVCFPDNNAFDEVFNDVQVWTGIFLIRIVYSTYCGELFHAETELSVVAED